MLLLQLPVHVLHDTLIILKLIIYCKFKSHNSDRGLMLANYIFGLLQSLFVYEWQEFLLADIMRSLLTQTAIGIVQKYNSLI